MNCEYFSHNNKPNVCSSVSVSAPHRLQPTSDNLYALFHLETYHSKTVRLNIMQGPNCVELIQTQPKMTHHSISLLLLPQSGSAGGAGASVFGGVTTWTRHQFIAEPQRKINNQWGADGNHCTATSPTFKSWKSKSPPQKMGEYLSRIQAGPGENMKPAITSFNPPKLMCIREQISIFKTHK